MFKLEFPGEGVVLQNFDEGVDSDDLNKYLHNDIQLLDLPDAQIEFCDEATMDVNTKSLLLENPVESYQIPTSPRGPPARSNFEGVLKFKVEIDSKHTRRKKYLYSHRLNRIYVDMNENFSVGFTWDANNFPGDAYIRATTVFSDVAQAEKRVERCFQHSHESSNSTGGSKAILMNVLHSAREFGSPDVHYCGIPDQTDSWYSVLIRTPQPTELAYLFLCKSSCSSGINRRPIDIIFTLEDLAGTIYGRQIVGARVCSCPRRDIVRDEEAEVPRGKRPALQQETKSKKVKLEVVETDDRVIKLPVIEVVGRRTAIMGLEVMLNMMEQKRDGLHANRLNTGDTLSVVYNLDTSIANLKKQINNLKGQKQ